MVQSQPLSDRKPDKLHSLQSPGSLAVKNLSTPLPPGVTPGGVLHSSYFSSLICYCPHLTLLQTHWPSGFPLTKYTPTSGPLHLLFPPPVCPAAVCMPQSLTFFWSLLQCYLLNETFPGLPFLALSYGPYFPILLNFSP